MNEVSNEYFAKFICDFLKNYYPSIPNGNVYRSNIFHIRESYFIEILYEWTSRRNANPF